MHLSARTEGTDAAFKPVDDYVLIIGHANKKRRGETVTCGSIKYSLLNYLCCYYQRAGQVEHPPSTHGFSFSSHVALSGRCSRSVPNSILTAGTVGNIGHDYDGVLAYYKEEEEEEVIKVTP